VDEEVITRGEVVELLFIVSGIGQSLTRIEGLFRGDDGEEEEGDEG
jgi:hypothetical protein